MQTIQFYIKYTILGIISVILWAMEASTLTRIISIFVFISCVMFMLLLMVHDVSLRKLTYYSEKISYKAPTKKVEELVEVQETPVIDRYIPQEKYIGKAGQARLKDKAVCIIGVGSMGAAVAELLARAGVGKLDLIDPNRLVLPDLQDHTLFLESDVGIHKATTAEDRLAEINSNLTIRGHRVRISHRNEVLIQSDLVLDCTNNHDFKKYIDKYCKTRKLAWIFCLTTLKRGYIKVMGKDNLKKVQSAMSIDHHRPILNPTIHMGAGIMATQALKLLLHKPHAKSIIEYNAWDYGIRKHNAF